MRTVREGFQGLETRAWITWVQLLAKGTGLAGELRRVSILQSLVWEVRLHSHPQGGCPLARGKVYPADPGEDGVGR